MDKVALEDLMLAVLENSNRKNFDALLATLKTAGNPIPAPMAEELNQLWENWIENGHDDFSSAFCLEVAALHLPDSPIFRKCLISAVSKALPPYLNRPPVMRAIGVRDDKLQLNEIAMRWKRLAALKNGAILFLPGTKRWGVVGTIDHFNGTLGVNSFNDLGAALALPLENVLREAVIMVPGPELNKLVNALGTMVTAANFRQIVANHAVLPVSENVMKDMAQSGCGRQMAPAAFETYWNSQAPSAPAGIKGKRTSSQGRSIQEMELLLAAESKAGAPNFTPEEQAAFRTFFSHLKPETARRQIKSLGNVIAGVGRRCAESELCEIFTPLRGKAPFWPENPAKATLDDLAVWGDLPAKNLEEMAEVTAKVFDEDYLATCSLLLPLKALNCICPKVSVELLYDVASESRNCGADLLLWIWKNRKKHNDEDLLSLVSIENVTRALSVLELPRIWNTALRELRTNLMEKADFQKQMVLSAGDNLMMLTSAIQSALFLSTGERQSLLVKFARHSDALRDYLENGAGQRVLTAGAGQRDAGVSVPEPVEAHYTSVKSHKRLIEELENVVSVQIPENREALKTARAHGDFRENSEFDAAKERRNYLRRHREELEHELTLVQPIIMRQVEVAKQAVIGSEIDLEYNDGAKETYYLVGAWDGDPDRHFLSYRTRLGEAVLNRTVGDEFDAPANRKCKLTAVRALPEALIAEFDC